MKKNNLKKICICAILSAVYFALEYLSSTIGKIAFLDNYQIPISCFPLIIASVFFGVKWGAVTAVVGSFLSQIPYGLGWATLIWMMPTVLYAIAVAVLYLVFRKSNNRIILAIEFFISSIFLSCLNLVAMYFNNLLYGIPYDLFNKIFAVIVSLKLIGAIVFAIIFAVITPPIIKKIRSIVKI